MSADLYFRRAFFGAARPVFTGPVILKSSISGALSSVPPGPFLRAP
jgi:hypothetical protein